MPIDWAATGTWMQAWAGFAQAGAIGIAAWKAADTFRGWRKQKLEERRIAAAEDILTTAYRLQRAFSIVRNSVTSVSALEEARARLKMSGVDIGKYAGDQQIRIVEAQVIFDRIDQFALDWDKLSALTPLAIALFGSSVGESLEGIWKQKVVLQVATEQYTTDDDSDVNFSTQVRDIIWSGRAKQGGREDQVERQLERYIIDLEQVLLPIVRSE